MRFYVSDRNCVWFLKGHEATPIAVTTTDLRSFSVVPDGDGNAYATQGTEDIWFLQAATATKVKLDIDGNHKTFKLGRVGGHRYAWECGSSMLDGLLTPADPAPLAPGHAAENAALPSECGYSIAIRAPLG